MTLQKRFIAWRDKMRRKSEEEKHVFSITVALLIGALITFLVIMNWYYTIVGVDPKDNVLHQFEVFYLQQKATINTIFDNKI